MSDVNASAAEPGDEAPPKRGFQIGARFYPMTHARKIGDPPLVNDIAGMSWDEYLAGLGYPSPDGTEPEELPDPAAVMAALIAVAVSRGNPNWPRHKVVAYVSGLDSGDVEVIGLSAAAEETGDPPTAPSTTTASGDPTPDVTAEPSPKTPESS
jgi:hypothetical protein